MRELQDRRRWRRLFYSPTIIVILFLILIMLGRATWGMYQKNEIAFRYRNQSAAELAELKHRAEELSANVNRLKTERGVEAEIRKNFSVVKEGEFVITVVDPDKNDETDIPPSAGTVSNFWRKIKMIFTGGH